MPRSPTCWSPTSSPNTIFGGRGAGSASARRDREGTAMDAVPPRSNMPAYFGIRIVSGDKDKVVGEIDADERHLNGRGVVHGGAMMAFADDLGGTTAGLNIPPDATTTTIESKSNFFRACPRGRLVGVAVPVHVGRRT